ncbi:unnamed protein product [Penicillium bialowiezense]
MSVDLRVQKANWTSDWVEGVVDRAMAEDLEYPPFSGEPETGVNQENEFSDSFIAPGASASTFLQTTASNVSDFPELVAAPGRQDARVRKLKCPLRKLSCFKAWLLKRKNKQSS